MLDNVKKYLAAPMIVSHLLAQMKAPVKRDGDLAALDTEIGALKSEIERGAALVFSGNAPAAVVDGLRQREARLRDLQAKREHVQGMSLAALPDLKSPEGIKAWQESLKPVLAVLHDGLDGDPALARQHLRWVLPRKVTVTPMDDASGAVSWKVEGPVGFEGVAFYLDGTKEHRRVDEALAARVTRAGHCRSQKWWPRGDSNTRHAV